ncbi:MAG: transglycosylase SLT domain-containing protein [Myxococcota bacterium]
MVRPSHILRLTAAAALAAGLASCAGACETREAEAEPEPPPVTDGTAQRLARAFAGWVTVRTRPDGVPIYAPQCRRFEGGCPARLAALAGMIAQEADRHDLDPFLVGAIAVKESGLDPAAVGPRGSVGILQLNPRGVGAGLRFTRDAAYRNRCARTQADACQGPIVERGVKHLADWIERCGDLVQALGGYNSGECRRTGYGRRVVHLRKRLRALAAEAPGT